MRCPALQNLLLLKITPPPYRVHKPGKVGVFFVPAGRTVEAPVPSGYFYVYFAYGTDWYGPEYIFGPETRYTKDDELSDYVNYTWEYTLYPSYNGNFSETPVDPEDF